MCRAMLPCLAYCLAESDSEMLSSCPRDQLLTVTLFSYCLSYADVLLATEERGQQKKMPSIVADTMQNDLVIDDAS